MHGHGSAEFVTPKLSVVIPTLGGAPLDETLRALHAGTVVPDEILVCIPVREAATLRELRWPGVRVVATDRRGQVAQRAVGFRQAAHPLVLQLDDDLLVAPSCIELLRSALLRFGPGWAVSPALVDSLTGESVYRMPPRASLLAWLQFRLLNGADGYQPGRVLRSGAAVGVDPLGGEREFVDVEWLPGGCVLHRRDELVLDDFYPFPGKAYCEDIIHSHNLTIRGIRLRVVVAASCVVEVPRAVPSPREFWRDLTADLRARRHYMRLAGRPSAHTYLFALTRVLSYVAALLSSGRRRADEAAG